MSWNMNRSCECVFSIHTQTPPSVCKLSSVEIDFFCELTYDSFDFEDVEYVKVSGYIYG